ncbi:MAG: class I SAM-dependent methyltransferase [Chloroflexi bacterium]|nr:class I SAM-dependent methyltransferase [Chloroflexota bacterium]
MTTEPVQTWASTEAAEMWRQGAARRAQTLAVPTERMLEQAAVQPGQRVLDIAAGTGDQTVLVARIVGPSGSILATDISASMLDAAALAAREAGLDNVETRVADASALELPADTFDAAISRFGLMFLPNLAAALTRIHDALKPGARFAALVWSTEANNPYIGLQLQTVRDMGRMPSPPPSFTLTVALGEPGKLARALQAAGFTDVNVSPVPTPRNFESIDDALLAMQTTSPAQGELGRAMSAAEREQHAAELKRRLANYVQADGRCVLPGEALLGVGTKPRS